MENESLRQRAKPATAADLVPEKGELAGGELPDSDMKSSTLVEILRCFLLWAYSSLACCSIVIAQFSGVPLYWYRRDLYYSYMALTKQSFGILVTTVTQWWSPTVIRISGDASVAGQVRKTADGRVECHFPDRMVMIANHQIYSDWLYLWWIAYTNQPRMHGYIYIILKESLKYVPVIGWGMMFYGFVFMSRKMATDQPRLAHRLKQLKKTHPGPVPGSQGLDPMWLLLFPEGTNASNNGRRKSSQWAEKTGVKDMEHQLLPRSTGSFFCLNELKGTVDYVYDCTMAYEGVPRGKFGQDYFSLRSIFLQGLPPKSVNMYWRRFAVKDIPLDDHEKFDLWLRNRWYEKDAFMEQYLTTGRFPATETATNVTNGAAAKGFVEDGFIETEVKLAHWWEVGNMFVVSGAILLVINLLVKAFNLVLHRKE